VREHRRALVVTLLVLGALALVVIVVKVLDTDDDSGSDAAGIPLAAFIARQKPAQAPFEGLGEVRVTIGQDNCLRLAVADSLGERVAGLRNHTELGPYDGMVFVFQGPTEVGFTMSGVTVPLDIGFYGADGAPVSHRLMKPCPDKAENECPVYRADGTFAYAVETLKDKLPSGPLRACRSS
jgi:uncharacterized membrane protein (UPF0127 family)